MNRKLASLGFASALVSTLWAGALLAQTFSVDAATPGLSPNVIYGPGPVPLTAPVVTVPPLDVDCFSYSTPLFSADGVVFSVSMVSTGAAGSAVLVESMMGPGEQAADIFFSGVGMGTNILLFDGDGSTPPGLGLPEPLSNIDGVDATVFPPPPAPMTTVFFTLGPGSIGAAPYGPGASAATIYVSMFGDAPSYALPGGFTAGVYALPGALGLVAGDNIDGLHVMEDGAPGATALDEIYFSLAPGSASLVGGPPPFIGASPAAVFVVSPIAIPTPAVFALPVAMGLLPGDNIDALSMHFPGAGVPVEVSKFNIE